MGLIAGDMGGLAVTRTNYNVRGTALQTADLIEKYVLPSLPCAQAR
ncbi:MAG TPA: hypothetical protein VMU01_02190 [Rhizomicrobium sp.]|nr:hypothetical protein [Rhizomicrobium sp.]